MDISEGQNAGMHGYSRRFQRRRIPPKILCSTSSLNEYPSPRQVENFITPEEALHLRILATPLLVPSKVNAAGTVTASNNTNIRRSWTAELPHAALSDDPILRGIGERVAQLSGTDIQQQEPLQVVRYLPGDYFSPHYDAGRDFSTLWLGQRRTTVLLYLNEDFSGGSTAFPELGINIKPANGKALLFANLNPVEGGVHAVPHPLSLHAGQPMEAGEKWAVNVWIREKSYLPSTSLKIAVVTGYLAFWAVSIITIAVVFKPSWLIPS